MYLFLACTDNVGHQPNNRHCHSTVETESILFICFPSHDGCCYGLVFALLLSLARCIFCSICYYFLPDPAQSAFFLGVCARVCLLWQRATFYVGTVVTHLRFAKNEIPHIKATIGLLCEKRSLKFSKKKNTKKNCFRRSIRVSQNPSIHILMAKRRVPKVPSKWPTLSKHRERRHIEDVPFYKIQHSFDELPLDPIKPFIVEKIRK